MATFDQLSAEQRAILELVLKQEQSYDGLADMLAMPRPRVRELARDALVRLSPVSAAAVDEDWRAQLADYLLNQQNGPEATATRGHLRRSEAARGWARSVLDSLDQFYKPTTLPTIPSGDTDAGPRRDRRRRPREVSPSGDQGAGSDPRPPKPRRSAPSLPSVSLGALDRTQRMAAGGGLAAVLLIAILLWPIGLLTGGDESDGGGGAGGGQPSQSAAANTPDAETRITLQLPLAGVEALDGSTRYAGVAAIAENGEQRQMVVRAKLPATKRNEAYQVWLYNSDRDVRSLGAQTTDAQGVFQGLGPLPDDYETYEFVDISREPLDRGKETHSGDSVLRGTVADFAAATQEDEGG